MEGESSSVGSFSKFISLQGIKCIDNFGDTRKEIVTAEKIQEQLALLNEFHKKTLGFKNIMCRELQNKTGKTLEKNKIEIKRLKRELVNLKDISARGKFEELLWNFGFENIDRAEKCFAEIKASDYVNIIRRSMRRTEICLTKVGFDNLRKTDCLEIIDLKKSSYDNFEMDAVKLLSYFKRKRLTVDWRQLVHEYCYNEELSVNSEKFILAMISYPYEFIKYCNRYRKNNLEKINLEKNNLDYERKLKKAMRSDGESLI